MKHEQLEDHHEPERLPISDLKAVRKVAGILRNAFVDGTERDAGETPTICEMGSEEAFNAGHTHGHAEWEPHEWHYALHVGCGEICPVLATVPYDPESCAPDLAVARAIAQAGGIIFDLAARVEDLETAAPDILVRLTALEDHPDLTEQASDLIDLAIRAQGGEDIRNALSNLLLEYDRKARGLF